MSTHVATNTIQSEEIKVEWGASVDPAHLETYLRSHSAVKAVFVTHSETSTGAMQDVKEVARVVRSISEAAVVVDGITSVGSLELRMDEWGIDVVITGSQKGLMIPPGLAFISLSNRAWSMVERSSSPKYYFSLQKAKKALGTNETPWTPAVSLLIGLDAALRMVRDETIEKVWQRHAVLADAVRSGCTAVGLRLLAGRPSNALTAAWIPESIDAKKFSKTLKSTYGITVAGGQGTLKGKIFRISHLGYYDLLDAITVIGALELTLRNCGWKFDEGAGVRAVQHQLAKFRQDNP